MNSKRVAYSILFAASLTLLFFALIAPSISRASADAPLAARCPGLGSLAEEEDYCGCTWGEVYYEGEPILDAEVSLTFGDQMTSTTTFLGIEGEAPYFDITGASLGAKRGDIMTLTVRYAGQTIVQPFRATPNAEGEQHVPIVLPDTISTKSIGEAGYGRAVAADDSHIWAAGPSGLQRSDLDGANPQDIDPPWTDPALSLLETGSTNTLWAVGSGGLAYYDGSSWITDSVPMSGTIQALAYDANTNRLLAGGGTETVGLLLQQDDGGAWETVETFDETVTALHMDGDGGIWVGTWGDGAFYRATPTSDWIQQTAADGLASDFLYDLEGGTTEETMNDVWFGTRPYLSGSGPLGGLGQYQSTADLWNAYTTTHNLVADELFSGAADNIYAVAVAEEGNSIWIGTDQGIQRQIQPGLWADVGPTLGRIYDMTALPTGVVVAHAEGVTLYRQDGAQATMPEVSIDQTRSGNVILQSSTLYLTASAQADDSAENDVVGWIWMSDIDGPLCTTAGECSYDAADLQLGEHTISVQVQDKLGNWSTEAATTVTVSEVFSTYLPSLFGGSAVR